MNTKTHTLGPWDVETPFDGFSIVEAGKPTFEWRFIAHVPTEKENDIHFLEAEANARLIAAAPDLLEALEACIEIVRGAAEHPSAFSPKIEERQWDAYHQARAAIKKARGE